MIYIDASRYSSTKERTGVENYSYHLINQLTQKHAKHITLITPKKVDLEVEQIVIPFKRLWTQLRLSWEVFWNRKIDNLFVPSHVLPIIHPKKSVITIHDVAFKRYPESYGRASHWYLDWSTRFAVNKAAKIIVPSEATKKDLVKYYHANRKKIMVIPHGHVSQKERGIKASGSLPYRLKRGKYFLYIGRIESKKNIKRLIEAFQNFSREIDGYRLVLAGKPGVGSDEIYATGQDDTDIVFTDYIDEAKKTTLLKNALAFVFPSKYEGFGFPLLEAMEFHLPIIASHIPTSREIAGKGALFFNPEKTEELEKCLKEVAQKKETQERLKNNQKNILKNYSWSVTAEATWNNIIK